MSTQTIDSYIKAMASLKLNGKGILSYAFIAKHGKAYPAVKPVTAKMEAKQCYYNSALVAATSRTFTYCEGVAECEGLIPMPHAWNLTEGGIVVDNTWGSERPAAYFGVEFKTEFVLEFSELTNSTGIFESLYAANMGYDELFAYLESGVAK